MSSHASSVTEPYSWSIILIVTLLFTLTIILFYYRLDRYDPEPLSQLSVGFGYGVITPLISVPVFFLLSDLLLRFYLPETVIVIELILIAPIFEELFKAIFIASLIKKYDVDGPLDGFMYGIAVGAGFATVENLFYGFTTLVESGFIGALQLSVLRGGFSFVGHPVYSGIFGWGYSAAQVGLIEHPWSELKVSIGLHMLWNFNTLLPRIFRNNTISFLLTIFVILVILVEFSRRMNLALKIDTQLHEHGYFDNRREYKVSKKY